MKKLALLMLTVVVAIGVCAVPVHAQTETGNLQDPPLSACQVTGGTSVIMIGVWYAPHSTTTGEYSNSIPPGLWGSWECLDFDQASKTANGTFCPCTSVVTTEPTITVDVNPPHTVRSKEFLIVGTCG